MTISADEIDFNTDTEWAYARGHVHMEHFVTGDKINADHAEFNIRTDEGKFYVVDGTAPAKLMTNPFALATTNPFYFQAQWVDRIKNRYILHKGFVTDCKVPKPWWTFEAPVFNVIPGDRASARRTIFRLKHIPILYLPYFERPLGRNPRQSGFLTPNFGHTTLFGYVYGLGYYWAINRSYDMTAVGQYYTQRGPALLYDFRGKPNEVTDFNLNLFGVNDRGVQQGSSVQGAGGVQFELTARTQILGFSGRLDYNYLSSYLFRQTFSYSFSSVISSEVYSTGFLQRHFHHDAYTANIALDRDQLFENVTYLNQTPNQVIVQKLPSLELLGRDQQFAGGPIPLWFSFDTGADLLNRSEPTGRAVTSPFQAPSSIFSSGEVGRLEAMPRLSSSLHFAGFSLNPSISLGLADYTDSYQKNVTTYQPVTSCGGYSYCSPTPTTNLQLAAANLLRKSADFQLDLRLPTLEKIYQPPPWLHLGPKLKHIVEAEATYEYLTGVNEFQRIIRFDATDILSNTNQLTLSLTNRLYRKDKSGHVNELLTWRVEQARYFDPTFGGAVMSGTPGIGFHNVVLAAEELTPFAFIDGPRTYSPVVSSLSVSPYPFLSIDWRTDYDPLRGRFVDNTYGVIFRYSKFGAGLSDNAINTAPVLLPQANQIALNASYGNTNRKGWNVGGLIDYDRVLGRRLFDFVQTSYNTDCCGFSFQLRQYNLGIRNDNQYLFSFSLANLGTFGSLQRQERIF